ncbi:hypothetical protein [Legionella spiritensis]|uniref:hypothetical protein n=1 Tax=Legionella spiritensis TaxID=452 RepID=UPI000F6F187B|nr:hypothetical protein [Legionella spiritensis]VEG90453.1 coiled-coil-containing protein [Legionella spiritensis]
MSKNSLFHFLDSLHNPDIDPTKKPNIPFKVVKKGRQHEKRYFLIALPGHKESGIRDDEKTYTLQDHHISIYQAQYNSIQALSQYHYTATFLDDEGNTCKLHVYFNDKDTQHGDPVVTMTRKNIHEKRQKEIPITPGDHLAQQFSMLAEQSVKGPVSLLKTQQSDIKNQLIEDYERYEQQATALSSDLKTNFDEYLRHLDILIKITHHLGYVTEDRHYPAINKTFTQRKAVLLADSATSDSKKQSPGKPGKTNDKPGKAQATSRKQSAPKKQPTPLKSNATKEYEQNIHHLLKRFHELDKDDLGSLPSELIDIQEQTSKMLALLEFERPSVRLSASSLERLITLQTSLKHYGKSLFTQLLAENRYELAGLTGTSYHCIDESILAEALKTGNAALLDFALTYGKFSINSQAIDIDGQRYKSAVHYCFSNHSKKHPLVDCLSVLIKHNASLMVTSKNGLPIINTILSPASTNHPLYQALEANREKTLDSRSFYLKLANTLRHYLSTHNDMAPEKKENIMRDIDFYQSCAHEHGQLSTDKGRMAVIYNTKARWMSTLPTTGFPQDLLEDKDIQLLCVRIEMLSKSFFANLEKAEQNAVKKFFANLPESPALIEAEQLKKTFSELPDAKTRKAFALVYLQDYVSMWTIYNKISTTIFQFKYEKPGERVVKQLHNDLIRMDKENRVLQKRYETIEQALHYFYDLPNKNNSPTTASSPVFAEQSGSTFFQPAPDNNSDRQGKNPVSAPAVIPELS